MRKILILEGSPRKHGNTARLAEAFARGARESGHLFGCDTRAMDDIAGKPVLAQAYTLGKEL